MIPNFFTKKPIPSELPPEMELNIIELKNISDKEKCLQRAYRIVTGKYHGNRIKTYQRLFDLFKYSPHHLWPHSGFLHCTNINYLLRILLIKSGHFTEDDIQLKQVLCWGFSPHQYLSIRVAENKYINIDPWAKIYGIKFGDYAGGFWQHKKHGKK